MAGASVRALAIALIAILPSPASSAAAPEPPDAGRAAAHVPVDLNRAPAEAIRALPVPPEVADAILDHRTYVALFSSVFDLLQVPGMTPELYAALRPIVSVAPAFVTAGQEREEEERRATELNYVVQRLLAEEGASEGLVDEYVDQIKEPRDVNTLGFFDLLGYQNVSPVDALAIVRERELAGRIENARQLRAATGLSYWGFRNLRDYVVYQPSGADRRLRADYQVRVYDTPYLLDDADTLEENILGDTSGLTPAQKSAFRDYERNTYAGRLGLDTTDPALTQKLRVRYGGHLRAGFLTHRNLGEMRWNETAKGFAAVQDLPSRDTPLGPLTLHNLVVGSYTASFGLGLVMDATDFFSPRRTGLGYSVRPTGLRGDVSRTEEYGLRGAGVEASLGAVRGTFFYSRDDKDAILNPDGSFNTYIRMTPRLSDDLLAGIRRDIASGVFAGRGDTSAFLPMRDVMDERVVGGNLKVEVVPGTWVGATGVEIRARNRAFSGPGADRFNPRPTTLVIDPARLEDRDSEIGAGYDGRALGNYRRVWGAEAQSVWRNLALAGEYGKLETSTEPGGLRRLLSRGPEAWIGQAYLQYENFTVLALYRDYDLGYDDPYDRAFSEDTRFEQTILDGNPYRLRNPYWAQLARFVPQPKAERGWFLNSRYQINRQFLVSGLEIDRWTRVADGADLSRVVARLEYRPIFPLRIRLRHAMSSRHADRPDDVRAYRAWDSRLELLANLSAYDQLRLLLSTGNVTFAERGRLSGPASGGDTQSDTTAVRGDPSHALQAVLTHNFNTALAVMLSAEVYDGFLYNYEDNEFIVVDGTGFRTWAMLRSRLSSNLSWRLKWTNDHALTRTYVDIRDFGGLTPPTPDATDARGNRSSFRFQLDLSL